MVNGNETNFATWSGLTSKISKMPNLTNRGAARMCLI